MFKRVIVIGALIALTGCATNQQSGQAIGAITGAIVGNSVGGGAGKAAATFIGTVVGSEVGRNIGASMDRPPQVVVQQQPPVVVHEVIREQPRVINVDPTRPDYSVCDQWNYKERQACYKGAEARARAEENRRIQDAYRMGRGQ